MKKRLRRNSFFTEHHWWLLLEYIPSEIHNTRRNSGPEKFCEKGVLKNFAKFTTKHLCQSLFFNKVAGLRPATLLKTTPWHRCFPVNFEKFLRTSFYETALSNCFWSKVYYNHQRGNQGPLKLWRDLSFNNNSFFCLSQQIFIVFLLFFDLEDIFLICNQLQGIWD